MNNIFRDSIAAAFACSLAIIFIAGTANGKHHNYTGNEACQECHKAIYDSWSKSAHGRAFELLDPGVRPDKKKEAGLEADVDYTNDKSCVPCHVTGWEHGGYSFDKPDDRWKGIGCEECHGPAEKWNKLHQVFYEKKKAKKARLSKKQARKLKQAGKIKTSDYDEVCAHCHYGMKNPYNFRDPHRLKDLMNPEYTNTYHGKPGR